MRNPLDTKKYFLSFLITLIVFTSVVSLNNFLDVRRYNEIRSVQDNIELDFISSETQFDLLKEISCKNAPADSLLSRELGTLASKLSYIESNDSGQPSNELVYLKKKYSLLQIKDHLLMSRLADKCPETPTTIMYFYGNIDECPDCSTAGEVLTHLRRTYPDDLRIYSFDYNLELSALDTLKSIYKIEKNLPALVINDNVYYGSTTIDSIKQILPELKKIDKEREAKEQKVNAENARLQKSSTTDSSTTSRSIKQ